MSGGRCTPFTPGFDRYTSVVDRYVPTAIDRYGSRIDRVSPPEIEVANCCRQLLMSRLQAAESLNKKLSEEAYSTNRLRCVRPPGQYNVDLAIEQLRAQLLGLFEEDVRLIRQLLAINEQMEDVKWQRKFGEGSTCSPSTYLSGSCTAEVESGDLDPYMDYFTHNRHLLTPTDDRIQVGSRDAKQPFDNDDDPGRDYTDETGDDVFHMDDVTNRQTNKVTNEIRMTLMPSRTRVQFSNGAVQRSEDELRTKDLKHPEVGQTARFELQINGSTEPSNENSRPQVKIKGLNNNYSGIKQETAEVEGARDPIGLRKKQEAVKVEVKVDPTKVTMSKGHPRDIREKQETTKVEFQVNNTKGDLRTASDDVREKQEKAKVEFKVEGAKDASCKPATPKVEIRFTLQQPHTGKNIGHCKEKPRKTGDAGNQPGHGVASSSLHPALRGSELKSVHSPRETTNPLLHSRGSGKWQSSQENTRTGISRPVNTEKHTNEKNMFTHL